MLKVSVHCNVLTDYNDRGNCICPMPLFRMCDTVHILAIVSVLCQVPMGHFFVTASIFDICDSGSNSGIVGTLYFVFYFFFQLSSFR